MEAALLVVVDDNVDGKQWYISIHKEATYLEVAAGVCSCAKVAERETGLLCSNHTPPYCRSMMNVGEAHPEHDGLAHGTGGATDSSAERRGGHLVNRGFNVRVYNAAPLSTSRTWRLAIGSTTESRGGVALFGGTSGVIRCRL